MLKDELATSQDNCIDCKLTTGDFRKKSSNKKSWKTYGDLFAQVTTVKVLIAEPTTPARTDPSIA
jgi:hypothetical protein